MKNFGALKLAWLEAFVEVAGYNKRTAAAAAIGAKQSTVSKYMDKLWAWYGEPLVVPGSSPVRLTPAGADFLKVAQDVVQSLRDARPTSCNIEVSSASSISGTDIQID